MASSMRICSGFGFHLGFGSGLLSSPDPAAIVYQKIILILYQKIIVSELELETLLEMSINYHYHITIYEVSKTKIMEKKLIAWTENIYVHRV